MVFSLRQRFGMTAQADVDRIGLGKSWLPAGVRAVAVRAIACRPGMRNFGSVDVLGFIVVASHAQRLGIGLGQHHFAIFGRRVADFALLVRKRRMREFRHQLRRRRFVWIVTAQAIRRLEWLVLVRLFQIGALYIVTIDAKRWGSLGQVIVELALPISPVLCVTWQVSQPISRAACRLPFSGTFSPVLWQLRQRFSF